jgi:hypothetical protein
VKAGFISSEGGLTMSVGCENRHGKRSTFCIEAYRCWELFHRYFEGDTRTREKSVIQ